MSIEDDEEIDEQDNTPLIKRLREQLSQTSAELKESRSAQRELAFIKAGVNTEAKAGQLLLKSWDGTSKISRPSVPRQRN